MQVSVESTGNLERRVILSLPAGDVDTQVGGRLREIARTARIKGFRPGKVPTKVIEQRYGGQVRAEIVDGLLRQGMDQAVRENELRIAGAPQISQDVEAGEGELKYVASLELVPEFGDLDMTKLQVVRNTSEVTDADIERMLENLRQQRASWTKVVRAAKTGDMANLETASTIDGARMPAEGFEKTSTVLGSGAMYPEVEAAIAGMQPGEEKTLDVTLPADWHMPQFAGKTVTSTFKLVDVAEQVLPEVDAAFIRSFGVKSGDLDQFKAEIRSNLERELKGALMNRLRREVGEQLIAAYADVELPAAPGRERSPRAAGQRHRAGPPPGPAGRCRHRGLPGRGSQARPGRAAGRRSRPPQRPAPRAGAPERNHAFDRLDLRTAGAGHCVVPQRPPVDAGPAEPRHGRAGDRLDRRARPTHRTGDRLPGSDRPVSRP